MMESVRTLRMRRKLSQKRLAQRAGVSLSAVRRVEAGAWVVPESYEALEVFFAQKLPPQPTKKPQGFALLGPDDRQEKASEGGRAVQNSGNARQLTAAEASRGGQKGGAIAGQNRPRMGFASEMPLASEFARLPQK